MLPEIRRKQSFRDSEDKLNPVTQISVLNNRQMAYKAKGLDKIFKAVKEIKPVNPNGKPP